MGAHCFALQRWCWPDEAFPTCGSGRVQDNDAGNRSPTFISIAGWTAMAVSVGLSKSGTVFRQVDGLFFFSFDPPRLITSASLLIATIVHGILGHYLYPLSAAICYATFWEPTPSHPSLNSCNTSGMVRPVKTAQSERRADVETGTQV